MELDKIFDNPTEADIVAAWEAKGYRVHKRDNGWFCSRVHNK